MAIDAQKETICINQVIAPNGEVKMIEGDVIIPDIKPDVAKIINTDGIALVHKKEILNDRIRIEGEINTYIMYVSEGENVEIRGLSSVIQFSEIIDVPNINSDSIIDDNIKIREIETKILNSRKLSINALVEFDFLINSSENIKILKDLNNVSDIQKMDRILNIDSLMRN